jgi:hypothetical protein
MRLIDGDETYVMLFESTGENLFLT